MIDLVEQALVIWGDEYRRSTSGAALSCVLGVAIDSKGVMVRGTPGSVPLLSTHLGQTGEAVEAALVHVRMHHPSGEELVRLARVRYLTDPMPLVRQQVRRLRYSSERVYRSRLMELHQALEPQLKTALPWFRKACA